MNLSEIANKVYLFKPLSEDKILPKSTEKVLYHIVYAFSTDQIIKQPKRILVKDLTQCVLLNHSSMNKNKTKKYIQVAYI